MVGRITSEKIMHDIGSFSPRQLSDMANAVYFSMLDDRKENTNDNFYIRVTKIDYSGGFVYYERFRKFDDKMFSKGALFFKDYYCYLNDSKKNRYGDLLG